MSAGSSSSARASGLRLTLGFVSPADVTCEGDVLAVRVRAEEVDDEVVLIDEAAIELVRTLTYTYRRGNSAGTTTPAIERVETVVDRSIAGVSGFTPGEVVEREVKLTVPADGPGTATGRIVRIEWAVRARFTVPGRPATIVECGLTVRSRALPCAGDASTAPVQAARRGVAMAFDELSSRTLLPGIPLTGSLHISASRPVPARLVRVELVLLESVAHGPGAIEDPARSPADDGKDASTVVTRAVVACRAFAPGQWLDVPFRLEVPAPLPAPSLQVPGIRIRWELRGVVDLPLRLDPRISLGLVGATTASW